LNLRQLPKPVFYNDDSEKVPENFTALPDSALRVIDKEVRVNQIKFETSDKQIFPKCIPYMTKARLKALKIRHDSTNLRYKKVFDNNNNSILNPFYDQNMFKTIFILLQVLGIYFTLKA